MHIGRVIGKVIAPQKNENLRGAKLLIVKTLDENQEIIPGVETYVAVDDVGAGYGDDVIVEWGSSLDHQVNRAGDMHIVGIIEAIQFE